jgi:asparagine synthase (glutamine-hydrolysing)
MCGIFGSIGKNQNGEEIKNCLNSIAHRGPDDEGIFQDENLSLGFRRLSIIDLSEKGHQPMANENKTVWVVFNGEIYNYQEIKKELENKHLFSSETDTEVLIHGFEEWGIEGLLKRINGMYGFCLYDQKNKKAYLVRDRIGKKPLYYCQSGGSFYFSSEAKAFLKLKDFKFDIDEKAFSLWMGFPYLIDSELTLLRGVKKIPPASFMEYDLKTGKKSIKKYYRLEEKKNAESFASNIKILDEKLNESIKNRLIADVPLGVLLSGGLDSSLIAAIAAKHKPGITTINISFPGTITDESGYAEIAARHCKTNHINLRIDAGDMFSDFRENIWIYDDLSTPDGGLYSTFLLSKKIREQGIKVALVGEGADEVFCGYSWFSFGQLPFRIFGRRAASFGYYYAIMRIFSRINFLPYPLKLDKILSGFSGNIMEKIQKNEILNSLPNHYCMKVDKGSSAASIEARAPYLDYKIADFAVNIPRNQKIRGEWYNEKEAREKYILREVAKKYLPKEIYARKKKGGMMPTYKILEEGLKIYGNKIISNERYRPFFSKIYLEKLIKSRPKPSLFVWQREWILWKLLIFEIWHEYFEKY